MSASLRMEAGMVATASAKELSSFLRDGRDVNEPLEGKKTLLMFACHFRRPDLVRVLLDRADTNPMLSDGQGRTALDHAVRRGDMLSAALLLSTRKTTCANTDEDGNTALHHAAARAQCECLWLLLEHDLTTLNVANGAGHTPLHVACSTKKVEAERCVQMLLDHGADIYAEDRNGRMPLHVAAAFSTPETIHRLHATYDDIDVRDATGWSALHHAVFWGEVSNACCLLDVGASAHLQDPFGWTPLFWAARFADVQCMTLLKRFGADHSQKDALGVTPLDLTASGSAKDALQEVVPRVRALSLAIVDEDGRRIIPAIQISDDMGPLSSPPTSDRMSSRSSRSDDTESDDSTPFPQ